jgi:omega-6 fatty acid desaturase (delta-12 desaturase)
MKTNGRSPTHKATRPRWCKTVAKYARADLRKATWQIIDTFVPYFVLLAIMIYTVKRGYPYWITLALCIPTAAMLTRIFIIFHDCCHKSFFTSRRANTIFGYITGIVTLTPYEDWWHAHARHHATFGDLDRRGVGDIWTLTADEYKTASPLKRLAYWLYRNPLVMFGLGPSFLFFASFRYPQKGAGKRQRTSVIVTDIAILVIIITAGVTIGLRTYLLAQLPCMIVAATAGIWLFYVQHQFEGVRWARHEDWDRIRAALEGSSYYKLPRVLQWVTCNIGFHHVHHIDPRIPNYNLQRCYDEVIDLQKVKPLTIRRSLKSLRMNLWDEQQQKLVSFRSLR